MHKIIKIENNYDFQEAANDTNGELIGYIQENKLTSSQINSIRCYCRDMDILLESTEPTHLVMMIAHDISDDKWKQAVKMLDSAKFPVTDYSFLKEIEEHLK